jgi:predicted transcriptional regulator
MPTSTTTSVRLPNPLRQELERQARASKRGKNWIIKEALEQYLLGAAQDELRQEARRQSEAASRNSLRDAGWGERGGDTDGWRA